MVDKIRKRKWYRIGPHLNPCNHCKSIMTLTTNDKFKQIHSSKTVCFACGHSSWSVIDERAIKQYI